MDFKAVPSSTNVLFGLLYEAKSDACTVQDLVHGDRARHHSAWPHKNGHTSVHGMRVCNSVQKYLEDFREQVGVPRNSSKVCYVSMNKDSHVLEVPEDIAKRVSSSFNACAGKKGVKRFLSDALQDLNTRHSEALVDVEAAQSSILRRITASSIGDKRDMWLEVCSLNAANAWQLKAARVIVTVDTVSNGSTCDVDSMSAAERR